MTNDKLQITNQEGGQSLFELVVAIAISALIIVAIVALVSNSVRNATFSRNNAQAASYAQQTTEWLRSQRDTDISTFIINTETPVYCFPVLSWTVAGTCTVDKTISGTPFYREGHFTPTLVGGKTVIEANIIVSWTDAQGLHSVTSSTSFTDWRQR